MTSKEWKEYKIRTICEVLSSKRIFAADYVETGIPFYRSKEIIQKSLGENIEEKLYISKEKFLDIKTKFGAPQKLDLLLSAVGERSGIPYLVNDDEEFYFKDGNLIWFRNFNSSLINSNYLYYWLKSYTGQNSLQNLMIGSAQKALTIIGIKGLSIKLPPLETQEKIAKVLSSLDDKIELNNKINQNLEQQAQAIFKSWFVDFEPFSGKMPEDWRIGTLGEYIEIKRGGSPRPIQNFITDKGYKWLKISDVTSLQTPFIYDIKESIKESGLNKTVLLSAGTLVLSNSATPGIPKILGIDSCIHDGWLYFPESKFSNEYLYLLFKSIRKNLVSLGNGSVFTNLKTDILRNYQTVLPSESVLKNFDSIVKPIFSNIQNNTLENTNLTQLRDTLLPKLMSGEIDVDKI